MGAGSNLAALGLLFSGLAGQGGWAVWAGCVLASIAIELDRERCRNIRGETETEFVRNSKVLVDFEVRT